MQSEFLVRWVGFGASLLIYTPLLAAQVRSLPPQSSLERMTTGFYTRSHDYDLLHQDIVLRDIDWVTTSFTGRVTTTLVSRATTTDSILLDAGPMIAVQHIVDTHHRSLGWTYHDGTLIVRLATPVQFHDTVQFMIGYAVRAAAGPHPSSLHFIMADDHTGRSQQLWMGDAQTWVPTYNSPNDKTTWDLTVTVPKRFTVVSNGRLVQDTPAPHGAHTVHWRQERLAPIYLMGCVIAPLVTVHAHWRDVPLEYNVFPKDSALAAQAFANTPRAVEFYTRITGVPYPWPRYAQTEVSGANFAGYEFVGATMLYDDIPDARALLDNPQFRNDAVPHELAHQWFGDDVTTENWPDVWLNEGFAEFMSAQFQSLIFGRTGTEEFLLRGYVDYLHSEVESDVPLSGAASLVYNKGSLVLEMLKAYLGDARFWASLHTYLTEHAYGNAVTDDFRRAILTTTGENLDWFFNEWMYANGHPEFTVGAAYDSVAHRVTLTVAQVQVARYDSVVSGGDTVVYQTPAVFRMPVTIRVGTKGGDVMAHAWLNARQQTIIVEHVQSTPTMVIFDDANGILKSLVFPQPTAWLATTLARDANAWNNWWAILQLREHLRDSAATVVLAQAAVRSQYLSTRAQAVRSFVTVAAPLAVPVYRKALRDSSSLVRIAALNALASLGRSAPADLIALAQQAFGSDSSYRVQAAALRTLAKVDPAGEDTRLARARTMSSYEDIIRITAASISQSPSPAP